MQYKYPVYEPDLSGNEWKYVKDCIETSWISSRGSYIDKFENGFAEFVGAKHAVSVCNGTVSLHLAMIVLGIKEGDEVIVPTLSYIASVNPVKYVNATPVFVDSAEGTWQMDVEDVRRKITAKTKAIMVVHLYGCPCDMDALVALCKEHNIYLIEDCAEAIGTKYKGKHIGTFGDIASFSFYANKTITTGEGGMVVTNNENIAKEVFHLKMQGVSATQYWHDIIGYNYKMTNVCAAIGLAQLENINTYIEKKIQLAKWYKEKLKGTDIVFHDTDDERNQNSFWMCTIMVANPEDRNKLRTHLADNGIETRPVFYPIHTMPMYFKEGVTFKTAENISSRGINLPSYPKLKEQDIDYISGCIKSYFGKQ